MRLQDDLYVIKYENKNMVYSPLRRALFFADDASVAIINRYISNKSDESDKNTQVWNHIKQLEAIEVSPPEQQQIKKGANAVIIPTQICNLGCTYCYAREAHSQMNMPIGVLKTTLDFVLNGAEKKKNISFIGGGEPFVSWSLIQWAVEYLEKNKKQDDRLNIGVTTNATLFTEDKFQYVKEHNLHIGVSFEILEDVQNTLRPYQGGKASSFDIVDANIKKLIQYNIPYTIRSTITRLNVKRMPEMVEYVAKHYLNLKRLHLEQVTDSNEDGYAFYNEYIEYFYKAKEVGRRLGISVYNSISKSIHQIKGCFCRGELCITPTGAIVACHRVSSEQERAFPVFYYGQVNQSVVFDEAAEKKYLSHTYNKREECFYCYAYWHCAGICSMERVELTEDQISSKCEFAKRIIVRELYETLLKGLENNQ
ncbi:MAG: radical SAM protein [Bacteroidales bacterium]|nr:radical SAM protein [Bacteroidales bacterium]